MSHFKTGLSHDILFENLIFDRLNDDEHHTQTHKLLHRASDQCLFVF